MKINVVGALKAGLLSEARPGTVTYRRRRADFLFFSFSKSSRLGGRERVHLRLRDFSWVASRRRNQMGVCRMVTLWRYDLLISVTLRPFRPFRDDETHHVPLYISINRRRGALYRGSVFVLLTNRRPHPEDPWTCLLSHSASTGRSLPRLHSKRSRFSP